MISNYTAITCNFFVITIHYVNIVFTPTVVAQFVCNRMISYGIRDKCKHYLSRILSPVFLLQINPTSIATITKQQEFKR